jgi:MFS family permease
MSVARSGLMAGLISMTGLIGIPLGGILTDQWRKKKANARMLLPGVAVLIGALTLTLALTMHKYGVFLLTGMFISMFIPGAITVTQDVVHPGLRTTSRSINVVIQHLLGSALGPLIVGVLSDKIGLDKALLILPIFYLAGGTLFLLGSSYYCNDVECTEKIKIEFE